MYQRAVALYRTGNFSAAAEICSQALTRAPGNPRLMHLLASCSLSQGRILHARRILQEADRTNPNMVMLLYDLAVVNKVLGDMDAATSAIDRVIQQSPNQPNFAALKAEIQMMAGEHDKALATLEPFLNRAGREIGVAICLAKLAPSVGRVEQAAEAVKAQLDRGDLLPRTRMQFQFLLGDLLDRMSRYDEAFTAYALGNETRDAGFRPAQHSACIDRLISTWTQAAVQRLPRSTRPSDRCVFIVGMPRSGTSLVEQILASHPDVHACGEMNTIPSLIYALQGQNMPLTRLDALSRNVTDRLAREYLGELDARNDRAPRVTDKLPDNFLHLGPISAMLPQARVIHCVRNPLDTGLSCYFQYFASQLAFPYDLTHIGSYYNDYRRLMDHWKSVLDLPILDVVYEDLVGDLETHARRLIDYLGLDWNEACLDFHKTNRVTATASNQQVIRPIYTSSVGRYRNYEKHLGPLRASIDPRYLQSLPPSPRGGEGRGEGF